MNQIDSQSGRRSSSLGRMSWIGITMVFIGVSVALATISFYFYYPAQIGPEQPIPFSHRIHATEKKISCLLCHPESIRSPQASIPPLETCMLCHQKIIIHHPQIAKLRNHYFNQIPIEWARVAYLPDITRFNHQVHLRKGFDCSKCHGNIAGMDRIQKEENVFPIEHE